MFVQRLAPCLVLVTLCLVVSAARDGSHLGSSAALHCHVCLKSVHDGGWIGRRALHNNNIDGDAPGAS